MLQVTHVASASTQLRSFDKKISDVTVAQTLYDATLRLPRERSEESAQLSTLQTASS